MSNSPAGPRTISVARRALIVQRVLVDGWTSGEVGATFGVSERQVDVWVADYRRYGMSSLRHTPERSVGAQIVRLTIVVPIRTAARGIENALHRLLVRDLSRPVPLHHSNDEGHGRG